MTIVFHARQNGKFLEKMINVTLKKLRRMNQGSNSLKSNSNNNNYVRTSIQFCKNMILIASQKILFH